MQKSFLFRVRTELLVGLLAGAVFLGVGGRLVMRVIALATDRPPAASPSGTFTVLWMGMAAGVVGAVIHLLLVRFVPDREMLREGVFGAALCLLTARGLAGQFSLPAILFFLLVGFYGLTLVMVSERRSREKTLVSL